MVATVAAAPASKSKFCVQPSAVALPPAASRLWAARAVSKVWSDAIVRLKLSTSVVRSESLYCHIVKAVVEVLRSDWLTTGPKVTEFEETFAQYVGAKHAVAVSSGTAALHAAMYAIGIGPDDEVIVPPMTFAATANCVVYQGGAPVFSDVESDTLLLDPEQVENKITEKTKAIIGVDYAGQPCDWDSLRDIANRHGLALIADGCHAIGAEYHNRKVGTLADMTAFSFHPVKHITTGEGGMIVTNNKDYADKMRVFRSHGITSDARQREKNNAWFYEMTDLGIIIELLIFNVLLV